MKIAKTVLGFIYVQKTHILAVAVGGALGALTRLGVFGLFENQLAAVFLCNIAGSFLLASAVEMRRHIHPDVVNMVSVGFCGGLSIFASFSRDSVVLLSADRYFAFAANLSANFVLCVLAVFAAKFFASQARAHRDFLRERRRAVARAAKKLHLDRGVAAVAKLRGGLRKNGKRGAE